MNLAPDFLQQYSDDNGDPLAGGLVYSYIAGTTTPLATYTEYLGSSANTNPVVLDANGRASIWLDPTKSYKLLIKNSSETTIKTIDNIAGSAASGIPAWNANTTYVKGNLVADGTNQGLLYISLTDGNLNNALSSVTNWALFPGGVKRAAALSTNTTLAVTDHMGVVRSNTTAGALTHTLPACSTSPVGLTITVKDVGTGVYATTVKGSGSDTVDGNNTYARTLAGNWSARFTNNGTSWDVVAISSGQTVPTVQRFTSGSGTYTTPAGVKWIRVRMLGGGGGAGASGTAAFGSATAGGNTTFGSSLLTANGGSAGAQSGNAGGGAATANSPAVTLAASSGTDGQGALTNGSTGAILGQGGNGGGTPLGGGGGGGSYNAAGRAAVVNTGAGGGGGGGPTSSTTSFFTGTGGGAGAFIEAIITAPSATYAYGVGAAGAGGSAGTSGFAGGNGGSGVVVVEEYYQ